MNCRTASPWSAANRAEAGFTLAEVLAAMLFMAIVIPVAVGALRIANLAGEVATRKAVACHIAESVLNDAIVTGQLQRGYLNGTVREGVLDYSWTLQVDPSGLDTLSLARVQVTFPAQGKDYDVALSTLVDVTQ
jgi:type II secretory pathway pseudopilin PulG